MADWHRTLSMEGMGHRYEDGALLALRVATGLFLLYQSHDNVLSSARMDEFEAFMAQFGFWRPDLLAQFAIFWQAAAALILVFLGLYFAARGGGRYALDTLIAKRSAAAPHWLGRASAIPL